MRTNTNIAITPKQKENQYWVEAEKQKQQEILRLIHQLQEEKEIQRKLNEKCE